ncbi:MAG: hypothetical protein JWL93_2019 [Hyphomicrobiales bacterium]|nr:hypothetical protein [Hyphomicrobiales bacterium]
MIRLLVRLLALLLMAGGFVALVLDGTRSIAAGGLSFTTLGASLAVVFPNIGGLQAVIERSLHPYVWDPVLTFLLALPACIVFGLLGAGLWWLSRRRPPTIGYTSRP